MMVTTEGSAARTAWRRYDPPRQAAHFGIADELGSERAATMVWVIFRIGPALMTPSVSTGNTRCPNEEAQRVEIAGKKTVDNQAAGDRLWRQHRHVDAAERRRDPVQARVKNVDQHQRQPEIRHRSGEQPVIIGKLADGTGAIAAPPATPSGKPIAIASRRPKVTSSSVAGKALKQILGYRPRRLPRGAEVAAHDVADIVPELLP